jgi:two-component sensor histidine kinase
MPLPQYTSVLKEATLLSELTAETYPTDLAAEANHRVANSLSALAGLVQREMSGLASAPHEVMPVADVRNLLAGLRARIGAVAKVHRTLAATKGETRVELSSYLQPIAAELISSLAAPGTLTLHFACQLGCRLESHRALYLGLIVVELVTNSVKYAHPAGAPGIVAISCRLDPGSVELRVRDDGVGLPEKFAQREGQHGLGLIMSMAAQIGATASWHSSDLGLEWVLSVPTPECVSP